MGELPTIPLDRNAAANPRPFRTCSIRPAGMRTCLPAIPLDRMQAKRERSCPPALMLQLPSCSAEFRPAIFAKAHPWPCSFASCSTGFLLAIHAAQAALPSAQRDGRLWRELAPIFWPGWQYMLEVPYDILTVREFDHPDSAPLSSVDIALT